MAVRFLHNYVVSGEMVGEEPLFAARIIREFSEIKEFREIRDSICTNSLITLKYL